MNRREFLQSLGAVVPALSLPVAQSATTDSYYPRTDRVVYDLSSEHLTWEWTSVTLVQGRRWGDYVCISTVA